MSKKGLSPKNIKAIFDENDLRIKEGTLDRYLIGGAIDGETNVADLAKIIAVENMEHVEFFEKALTGLNKRFNYTADSGFKDQEWLKLVEKLINTHSAFDFNAINAVDGKLRNLIIVSKDLDTSISSSLNFLDENSVFGDEDNFRKRSKCTR